MRLTPPQRRALEAMANGAGLFVVLRKSRPFAFIGPSRMEDRSTARRLAIRDHHAFVRDGLVQKESVEVFGAAVFTISDAGRAAVARRAP